MKSGSVVSSIKRPINVLMGTAISVEIRPVIAAPIPAMWPTGSIASALRFPNIKPIQKNCIAKNPISTYTGGCSILLNRITYNKDTARKPMSEPVTIFSIPKRTTKLALSKIAAPIADASPAKMIRKLIYESILILENLLTSTNVHNKRTNNKALYNRESHGTLVFYGFAESL